MSIGWRWLRSWSLSNFIRGQHFATSWTKGGFLLFRSSYNAVWAAKYPNPLFTRTGRSIASEILSAVCKALTKGDTWTLSNLTFPSNDLRKFAAFIACTLPTLVKGGSWAILRFRLVHVLSPHLFSLHDEQSKPYALSLPFIIVSFGVSCPISLYKYFTKVTKYDDDVFWFSQYEIVFKLFLLFFKILKITLSKELTSEVFFFKKLFTFKNKNKICRCRGYFFWVDVLQNER